MVLNSLLLGKPLPEVSALSLKGHVEKFTEGWFEAAKRARDNNAADPLPLYRELEYIHVEMSLSRWITKEGIVHLHEAAKILLKETGLKGRVSVDTSLRSIVRGLEEHWKNAVKRQKFSLDAIILIAKRNIQASKRDDGTYFVPVHFSNSVKTTDLTIGPCRMISRKIFEKLISAPYDEYCAKLDKENMYFSSDWESFSENFDHVICVNVVGFEENLAWSAARDVADMFLNVIRMYLKFGAARDVRLAGEYIRVKSGASMRLSEDGRISLSLTRAWPGAMVEEGWDADFLHQSKWWTGLFKSEFQIAIEPLWKKSPIRERISYFNHLISEAYSEPHARIRLVRTIAALEAFAVIDRTDKAHQLANHCALAGGFGEPERYIDIYDDVKNAYRWRNAVVHGDAPEISEASQAFLKLERHLLRIALGFLWLFATISNDMEVRHIKHLRRAVRDRINLFFWDPHLLTRF